MHKKIGFYFLLSFMILLFTSSLVFAADVKDVTIEGLGTVTIPSDIEIINGALKGGKGHTLLSKDKSNIFRTSSVFCMTIPNANLDGFEKKSQEFLQSISDGFTGKTGKILKSEPFRTTVIGAKKVSMANLIIFSDVLAIDMSMYALENANGVVVAVFMCSSGDAKYWEPIRLKMIADAN